MDNSAPRVMKRTMLVVATMVLSVVALPANGGAYEGDPEPPSYVVPVPAPTAICNKRVCKIVLTCPAIPANEEALYLPCKVASDIFSYRAGRLTKDVYGLVTYPGYDTPFEDFPKQENIPPGETKRITMSVTPYGRYNFKEALRDGKRKLKGVWEAAVYWLDAEGLHNSLQERPVKIKLKGNRPRVKQ